MLKKAVSKAAGESKPEAYPRRYVEDFDEDRKSTRLNSSHLVISYAVFCLKKKKKNRTEMKEKWQTSSQRCLPLLRFWNLRVLMTLVLVLYSSSCRSRLRSTQCDLTYVGEL